jgi:hypothetical protein
MNSRSSKEYKLFQKFKSEAKIITIKGLTSEKKVLKWNGRIFTCTSFNIVFDIVKKDMTL